MALLKIVQYPDPILRQVCEPVETVDEKLRQLVADMVETMHDAPGIGLAAPQIGVSKRLAVIDLGVGEEEDELLVLLNPEIVDSSGKATDTEGCLSIQDLTERVTRPEFVTLRASNLEGESYEIEADGLLARAIQHELDHLDGVLFIDHLKGLRRERARRRLKRLGSVR
ncbi:MAG: peptide deformylase [Acidobacteriota bacterium]